MTAIKCPHGHSYGTCLMCYHDLVGELQERLAKSERDAERYRWLRDLPEGSPHEQIGNFPGDAWDAAIDAARFTLFPV